MEPIERWTIPKKLPDLSAAPFIALDVETYDVDLKSKGPGVRRDGYMVGIAVAIPSPGNYPRAWYVPFGHAEGVQFSRDKVLDWARRELTRPNQPKIGANILYDLDYLAHAGVDVAGPFVDVQIAESLIDENAKRYNLDALAEKYTGQGKHLWTLERETERRGYKGDAAGHIWRIDPRFVGEYAEGDVLKPLAIWEKQKPLLAADDLTKLADLEFRLIPVLLAMRRRGVRVNQTKAKRVRAELNRRAAENQKRIDAMVGFPVNVNANASIADAFDKLGLGYPRTAKTNTPSFTKDWLTNHEHEFPRLITEQRRLEKFVGAFIENAILASAIGDRVHCQFNQSKGDEYGTVTGRFSSSNPNLQQIPSRDKELAPLIRGIFVPDKGEIWGRADYSQIELRILAHYAIGQGAAEMRNVFRDEPDADFHAVCGRMAGIERDDAKHVNFAVLYGAGVKRVARQLNKTESETKAFLNRYHEHLPFVRETFRIAAQRAERRGWIKTILNRRRRFPFWEPADFDLSKKYPAHLDRQHVAGIVANEIADARGRGDRPPRYGVRRAFTYRALNALIQGSAADLMKKSIVDVWESGVCDILGPPLLTVHDELDVSVPRNKRGTNAFREMVNIMERAIPFRVPILVDSDTGRNWGECK